MSNLFVFGNGFTINLMKKLEIEHPEIKGKIDLKNLFAKGYVISAPNGDSVFLSAKNCPNLWEVGIRCYNDSERNAQIMQNIIYDFKVSFLRSRNCTTPSVQRYLEMNRFLRSLFIFYNSLIEDKWLQEIVDKNNIPILNEINPGDIIISYNYDIFLERLLACKFQKKVVLKCEKDKYSVRKDEAGEMHNKYVDVEYEYGVKEINEVRVYKPHGSIDYIIKGHVKDKENPYLYKSADIELAVNLRDKNSLQMDKNALIIPPFDALNDLIAQTDMKDSWVVSNRRSMISKIQGAPGCTTIYGLSYDLVDRTEINEIIACITDTGMVTYVNPSPACELDYILSHQFKNYKHKLSEV